MTRPPRALHMLNMLATLSLRTAAPSNQKPPSNGVSCPYCSSVRCHRFVRRGQRDFLRRLLGSFPWHCRVCRKRFYLRKRSLAWLTTA